MEAEWVLMWALGYIDELGWPASTCDVPRLVEVIKPVVADAGFIETAQLRPKHEILDAQTAKHARRDGKRPGRRPPPSKAPAAS